MKNLVIPLLFISFLGISQVQPLSNHDSAVVFKSYQKYEEQIQLNNKKEASRFINEIAHIYWNHNNTNQAIFYYELSWELNKDLSNENGMAMLNNNLGMLYSDLGEYQKSYDFFNKTLAVRRSHKEVNGIIQALINISVVLNNLKRYDESIVGLEEALSFARKENDMHEMRSVYGMLSETYEKKGDAEQSIYYFNLYRTFNDLIQQGEFTKLSTEVEEEKFLRDVAEKKNRISEDDLKLKRRELQQVESELDEFDSLNRSLFENLNNRELQVELLKQQASIDSLKVQEERVTNMATIEKQKTVRNFIIVIVVFLSLILILIVRNFIRTRKKNEILTTQKLQIEEQHEAILKGKEKSDQLLRNILPDEIAEELKEKGMAEVQAFDSASILFTDFVGFTKAASKMSSHELVAELNVCFESFDLTCEKYHVEKIKTIGDAYMAVGGLPIPTKNSVENTVLAALEMQAFIVNRKKQKEEAGEQAFEMRAGIHTGKVVAGIVGIRKFQYDIWGDAVNIAARFESNSKPGSVNISQATYQALQDNPAFAFESRGRILAKGKGELEMWFVTLKEKVNRSSSNQSLPRT
jgi:adenylate cyclase